MTCSRDSSGILQAFEDILSVRCYNAALSLNFFHLAVVVDDVVDIFTAIVQFYGQIIQ